MIRTFYSNAYALFVFDNYNTIKLNGCRMLSLWDTISVFSVGSHFHSVGTFRLFILVDGIFFFFFFSDMAFKCDRMFVWIIRITGLVVFALSYFKKSFTTKRLWNFVIQTRYTVTLDTPILVFFSKSFHSIKQIHSLES